ncbi:hypothetical protein SAMN03159335_07802 [Burkholderia cepacia]|nr:hypothetical protein SAMN03159335_07802 [Burkholderia cepacia]
MADEVSYWVIMTDDGERAIWERIRREARRCVSVATNGELLERRSECRGAWAALDEVSVSLANLSALSGRMGDGLGADEISKDVVT